MVTLCKYCSNKIVFDPGEKERKCSVCGKIAVNPEAVKAEPVNDIMLRADAAFEQQEFDAASRLYTSYIDAIGDNAHARWRRLLCKYGVEFVTDGNSFQATCHRTRPTSIRLEADYHAAIQLADDAARREFEEHAERIDNVQEEIRYLAEAGQAFEVFICYKQTDPRSRTATLDSSKAREIYNLLTNNGFVAFYAPETLKNKAGAKYEAMIYHALETSSVMLVLGSCREYMEGVWVRSEWERFAEQIAGSNGKKKMIPCPINEMRNEDMPTELAGYQSFDLEQFDGNNKLVSYLTEVIRGDEIRKRQLELEKRQLAEAKAKAEAAAAEAESTIARARQKEAAAIEVQAKAEQERLELQARESQLERERAEVAAKQAELAAKQAELENDRQIADRLRADAEAKRRAAEEIASKAREAEERSRRAEDEARGAIDRARKAAENAIAAAKAEAAQKVALAEEREAAARLEKAEALNEADRLKRAADDRLEEVRKLREMERSGSSNAEIEKIREKIRIAEESAEIEKERAQRAEERLKETENQLSDASRSKEEAERKLRAVEANNHPAETISCKKIKLFTQHADAKAGDKVYLKVKIEPENTTDRIEWRSDNEDIAVVDMYGCVICKAVGKCKITVWCGSVNDSCVVNVKPLPQPQTPPPPPPEKKPIKLLLMLILVVIGVYLMLGCWNLFGDKHFLIMNGISAKYCAACGAALIPSKVVGALMVIDGVLRGVLKKKN